MRRVVAFIELQYKITCFVGASISMKMKAHARRVSHWRIQWGLRGLQTPEIKMNKLMKFNLVDEQVYN